MQALAGCSSRMNADESSPRTGGRDNEELYSVAYRPSVSRLWMAAASGSTLLRSNAAAFQGAVAHATSRK